MNDTSGLTIGNVVALCAGCGIALDLDDAGHLTWRDDAGGDVPAHQARWLTANSVPLQTALQQRAALHVAYVRLPALRDDAARAGIHDDIEARRRLCANVLALPAEHPDEDRVPADA